jgi:hypothetical protein
MAFSYLGRHNIQTMRKLILSLCLLMSTFASLAQELQPDSRMIPGQKGLFFRKHGVEFRAAYGVGTVPDKVKSVTNSVTGENLGANGDLNITGGGAFVGSIIFLPDHKLSLGVDLVLNANKAHYIIGGDVAAPTYDMHYTSVLGRVDYHYVNLHHLKVYSSVAGGMCWRTANDGGQTIKNTALAYQVTPIGAAIGGKFVLWGELGYGYRGYLCAGVSLRF